MDTQSAHALENTEPPWETLVLVCSKCKGARRGPDSRGIRKGLKHRLGKSKQLRVLESECMSVCPDDAVTVCVARTQGHVQPGEPAVAVHLVRSDEELDQLAELLHR